MAKDHFREEMREYYGVENGECHLCKKIMLNEDCLLLHLPVRHAALDRLIPSKEFLLVTDDEERSQLSDSAELVVVSKTPNQSSKSFNDFKMPKPKKASVNETPMKRPHKPSGTPSKKTCEVNETPRKKLKTSDGFKTPNKENPLSKTPKTLKKVETPKPKNI